MNTVGVSTHESVGLLGVTRNTDNYGVRVLLTSAIEAIARREPGAGLILVDYGRSAEDWTERTSLGVRAVSLTNLRFSWKLYLPNNIFSLVCWVALTRLLPGSSLRSWLQERNPWLAQILRQKRLYSLAGGDSFSDIYGLERFVYVTLPQVLVLLLQRPLIQLPQTFGPYKSGLARSIARWILRRSEHVYSRDDTGREVIAELIGPDAKKVSVVPDIGFGMAKSPISPSVDLHLSDLRRHGPLVGLNASRLLYMGGYTGSNMFGLREPFPALIEAVACCIANELGGQVLLVPHVCGGPASEEDETRLCKSLHEALRVKCGERIHLLEQHLDHQQMKSVIGHCDLFVGARMHACIGAASQGVPTVCLAYSGKFEGVMKPFGQSVRVVDLRTHDENSVLKTIRVAFAARETWRSAMIPIAARVRDLAQKLEPWISSDG